MWWSFFFGNSMIQRVALPFHLVQIVLVHVLIDLNVTLSFASLKMQRKQAMCEMFWSISITCACFVSIFFSLKLNDPKKKFAGYNSMQADFHSKQTWAIYYAGYENMKNDGAWSYWAKPSANAKAEKTDEQPKEDFLAKLYPVEGYYSSKNRTVIKKHIQQIQESDINAIIIPWYSRHIDEHFSPKRNRVTDKSLSRIFGQVENTQVKIGILIPEYNGRTWETILNDIKDYVSKYGSWSSVLKSNRRPVVFIQNAQNLSGTMYNLMRSRRSSLDCYFVAIVRSHEDFNAASQEGYDAITTFYSDESECWLSNTENWQDLKEAVEERSVSLIPAVSPGSFSTDRNAGKYYGMRWEKAIALKPTIILVNSFNGWHEGTNIEPALSTAGHKLDDSNWSGENSQAFITITKEWSRKHKFN